jgi:hypothetical protein
VKEPTSDDVTKATPDMLAALQEIEPLLESARQAYQFGPSSYTYSAMLACLKARDRARAAIIKAGAPATWETEAKTR